MYKGSIGNEFECKGAEKAYIADQFYQDSKFDKNTHKKLVFDL